MFVIAWSISLVAIGILLNLAINIYVNHKQKQAAKYYVAFLVGICCYTLHSFFKWELLIEPENIALLSYLKATEEIAYQTHFGIWLLSCMVPWALWMFSRQVCREEQKTEYICAMPLIAIMSLNIFLYYTHFQSQLILNLSNIINFSLLLLTLYELLYDLKSDLSNRRRSFRNVLFSVMVITIFFVFFIEVLELPWKGTIWLLVARILVIFNSLFFSLLYFQSTPEAINEIFHAQEVQQSIPSPNLSNRAENLLQLLENTNIYTDANLSVAALANRMKISEHNLRDLIKAELGFRNFNAFINKYRVEYAAKILDEDNSVPVGNIMFDSGFKSHPPFIRAFREIYGISPTEYKSKNKQNLNIMNHKPSKQYEKSL